MQSVSAKSVEEEPRIYVVRQYYYTAFMTPYHLILFRFYFQADLC